MDDNAITEKSKSIQSDEALNIPRLYEFLRTHLDDAVDSTDFSVERFPQGYSNLTYLLRFGQQELVLRRPPIGANVKSGHDMAREYKLLTGLSIPKFHVPFSIAMTPRYLERHFTLWNG